MGAHSLSQPLLRPSRRAAQDRTDDVESTVLARRVLRAGDERRVTLMRNIFHVAWLLSVVSAGVLVTPPVSAQAAAASGSAQADLQASDVVVNTAGPARSERWFLTLEAGLAIPLNEAYREGYAFGAHGGIGIFRSLNRYLALGLRPSYGALVEDDEAGAGGYNWGVLSAAVRLRPLASEEDTRRSTGLWLEAAAGPAIAEGHLRAALTPGLGYTFPLGAVGLGPMARYVHVIESDAPDAKIAVVGVELTLLDGPRPLANGDRDGDGFKDGRDACPDQAEVFNGINDHDGCPDSEQARFSSDRFVVDERIFFEFDQSVLLPSGQERLKDVAELYKVESWTRLTVQGHADSRGSEEYNEELSRARAQAVKAYLVQAGIPEAKIDVESYGERRPIVPNADTPAEYQKNRRVEFVVKK